MTVYHTDVAVIGAGTAGLAAYRQSIAQGANTLLIEGGPYGTTCARVGCMPSKLLIAAADAHHALGRLPAFGIDLPHPPLIKGERVMARVRNERDRFVGFVVDGVNNIPDEHKIRGYARFVDEHTLSVNLEQGGQATIHAKTIVIASGSTPVVPDILKNAGDRVIINDDVFSWNTLPKSVLVVGAGVIGLELGQALSYLGVRVTLLGRNNGIGHLSDPVVRESALNVIKHSMDFQSDASLESVGRTESGVKVTYIDDAGQTQHREYDYILAATGRAINLNSLNFAATQLTPQANGVPAFNRHTLQIGSSHLFIAGDVNADVPLLHEAADEGAIAGANAARLALGKPVEAGERRSPIAVIFSEPNIAHAGQMYKELDLSNTAVGSVDFSDQGRSRVMQVNQGVLRVYGDIASDRFLGAEMVGPRNEHIAHLLAWSHQMGLTVTQMLAMPFYHPVIEEGLRTALRALAANIKQKSAIAPCEAHLTVGD
ncbi:dihydrolipoyl dehydrogenase [Hydromonas duriensis]|uniref:Dihydrolipoamide dehydrogenase n=1 Tax=Hydromonas duriensis TaxID=1527608 RepID=A0A4R6YB23_9BURK|nr:dihydrolipoyl dehydrogenase [Hydromonas duriensis]TDR32770.1 dihydrolipoamide dehydrogenase [Hydromonas duriensis]